MPRLLQLYCGLATFWGTYFVLSPLFPQSKAKSRPIAKITQNKVIRNLVQNCIATSLMIPLISCVPQIVWFPNSWYGLILKYLSGILMAEIWFYYTHRLLHNKLFYRWHSDHHAFIQPYALAGLYCSWLEMILVNQLSVAIPCQLLGCSQLEVIIGSIFVSLNVMKGHAGLQLYNNDKIPTWIPDWLISSKTHDIHHEKMTTNYGVLYLLDWIHGTYTSP
ncbi:Fatty acid hydroxylase [uncultured virus]|nr:Fatty acid hydroxylase [uncultured virus]